MTPTAPELLQGVVVTLSTPPQAEDAAQFFASRLGVVAMIGILAAQEAERGAAVRVAENADLRQVLAEGEAAHRPSGLSKGDVAADPGDGDLSIAALDAANAALRRRLIALHEAVEAAGDRSRDRAILALYRRMAAARELKLPSMPAA